ncbi:MAG: chemotaxis protein CheX [Cellulosilyticaceae bacterium]
MFTQFFGSYLLNHKLVSKEQLTEALEVQKSTHVKLGVLAINQGFMTAEQVDQLHQLQATVDKRIGDLAVEKGYMTEEQVNYLLNTQKTGYLLLGQALVDKSYMTNAGFEDAIKAYKKESSMKDMIKRFYAFTSEEVYEQQLSDYIGLLLRNIVRFIGDDFTPLQLQELEVYPGEWVATQEIVGTFSAHVAIAGDEKAFVGLASRYGEENFEQCDDYVQAAVGEFLNLQDGLFCVNESNERGLELDLQPQVVGKDLNLKVAKAMYSIPVCFPFGTLYFMIGQ